MKTLFQHSMRILPLLLLLLFGSIGTAMGQGAKLQLSQLDVLANKASETVDVNIDEHLIQMTAKLFSEKDDADIREVLKGVKGIYVKSFTFEKENEYTRTEVDSVLSQLRGNAWNKVVSVNSKKDGDNVEVYLLTQGDHIEGLAVVSAEPKEFTVVNIVGPVNLEKLTKIEGQFGVPDLGLDLPKPKKIN